MLEVMKELGPIYDKEREQHLGRINFEDVSERVQCVAETSMPQGSVSSAHQSSPDELITVSKEQPLRRLALPTLTITETQQKELLGGCPVDSVRVSTLGAWAIKPAGSDAVIVSGPEETDAKTVHKVAEADSFGFLSDGRFVHLDTSGAVDIDGLPAGLNRTRSRTLLPDKSIPAQRLEVNGNLILIEDLELDRGHENDMAYPTVWLGGPPGDYYQHWYYRVQRVLSAEDQTPREIVVASKAVTQEELDPNYFVPPRALKTDMHAGGFVTYIEDHPTEKADLFYHLPLYDKVHFHAPDGSILGSQRVDRMQVRKGALTVSDDAELGFIGKTDGTIEVVRLSGRPDAGTLSTQRQQDAWIEKVDTGNKGFFKAKTRDVAHFHSEVVGDPYPWRQPPSSIVHWKAHEGSVARLFWSQGGLVSVDDSGLARRWEFKN